MYDTLYKTKSRPGWLAGISKECRAWLEGLADHINQTGVEPVWERVSEMVAERFPNDAPNAKETLRTAVRHLVAERG